MGITAELLGTNTAKNSSGGTKTTGSGITAQLLAPTTKKTTPAPVTTPVVTPTKPATKSPFDIGQPYSKAVQDEFKSGKFKSAAETEVKAMSEVKPVKAPDLKQVAISLKFGVKALPSMAKTAAGILMQNWVDYTKSRLEKTPFWTSKEDKAAVKEAVGKVTAPYTQKATDIKEAGYKAAGEIQTEFGQAVPQNGTYQDFINSLAFNAPQVLANTGLGVVIAAVTKNPVLATSVGISTSYALNAGDAYNEASDFGELTEEEKQGAATLAGLVTAPIDIIPFGSLFGKVASKPVKKSLIKNLIEGTVFTIRQGGLEGFTEGLQKFFSNAVAKTYNENKNLLEGITEEAFAGMIFGVLIGGGTNVLSKALPAGKQNEAVTLPNGVQVSVDDKGQIKEVKDPEGKPIEITPVETPKETVVPPVVESKSTEVTVARANGKLNLETPNRGGTWYYDPNQKSTGIEGISNVGGETVTNKQLKLNNPIVIENATGDGVREMFREDLHDQKEIDTFIKKIAEPYQSLAQEIQYLQDVTYPSEGEEKISKKEEKKILIDSGLYTQSEISELLKNPNSSDAILDRVVSDGLGKNGYDSIVFNGEDFTHYLKFNQKPITQTEQVKTTKLETAPAGQFYGMNANGWTKEGVAIEISKMEKQYPGSNFKAIRHGAIDGVARFMIQARDKATTQTQKEVVKTAVAEEAKSIKQVAEETNIKEANIRRILGVGEKEGTFTRVEKGVYILNNGKEDIAFIHTGDAVETLPKLVEQGIKVDMVFLDIPYKTKAVTGGNRGVKYDLLSLGDFRKVVDSVSKIVKDDNTPVYYMYSQAPSGLTEMLRYNTVFTEFKFKPIAKGDYQKLFQTGKPVTNVQGKVSEPEGILLLNKSGVFNEKDAERNLDFTLRRPRGYSTEKPTELLNSLILQGTEEGGTVLDPFAGSGVTGEQAVKEGRKVILIEKKPEVVDNIIKPRVETALEKANANPKAFLDKYSTPQGLTPEVTGKTLKPSEATNPQEVKAEVQKIGIPDSTNNRAVKEVGEEGAAYNKPAIGKTEMKTLLTDKEFAKNPVFTVNEDKSLTFKSPVSEITVTAQALQLNPDNLTVGDEITVDIEAIKKGKAQQLRVYRGDEPLAFNPKNMLDPFSKSADIELKNLVRQSEIANNLSKKLGVPIRNGKFRHKGALGIYNPRTKVARYKKGGLPVKFHEAAGHYVDDIFKFSQDINITERKALMEEYGWKYEGQKIKQQKEAFAEFIRFRLTGQKARTEKLAPEFSKLFDEKINKFPKIKEVLDEATRDYKRWAEQPSTAKILSQISIGRQKGMPLVDRITTGLSNFYTSWMTANNPIDAFSRLAKKQGVDFDSINDPAILAQNMAGWAGKADLFLNDGTIGAKYWTRTKLKNGKYRTKIAFTGKSYAAIMKPIEDAGHLNDFRVYVVAQRVVNDLAPRGIESGISLKDAKASIAELEAKHPNFEKVAQERIDFNDRLLDYAVESGAIGSELRAKIKNLNKFHVPFYRVMEETGINFMGKSKMAGNLASPIKAIRGSDREIIDPFESDVKNVYAMVNFVSRNDVGIAIANLSQKNFELGRLFEQVVRPMKATRVEVNEVVNMALKGTGMTSEDLSLDMADMVTLFRPAAAKGKNMLNVNIGDNQYVYQVEPRLFEALQGLNKEDIATWIKIMALPAKTLRLGATLSPDFAVRNPVRDAWSAFIYSRYGFIPGIDFMKGAFSVVGNDSSYKLWKAGGGQSATMISIDREGLQGTLKDILASKGEKNLAYIKNPFKLLQLISELGEEGSRLGEMKKALSAGADPVTAANASRELTLDFARIGAKARAMNMITAFWNARLQAPDKFIRSFKAQPMRTLTKSLISITLPSLLLYMANKDDERWDEIPQWQKDIFWIVLTKPTKVNPSGIWRIPKPFELGLLFGSVPERIWEYIETKNPEIFDSVTKSVLNGLSPGFLPTAILPIIENLTNYSFFREAPIVGAGKAGEVPSEQYGTFTTELAKQIGKIFNYSPSKIDNLINGYTGGLGKYATETIDKILLGTGIVDIPTEPAVGWENAPVLKAFMVREPIGSASESVNKVYELSTQYSAQMRQYKKLLAEDITKAEDYLRRNPKIIYSKTLNQVVAKYSDINKLQTAIRQDRVLTANEKRDKLRELDILKTDLGRMVLETINPPVVKEEKKSSSMNPFAPRQAMAATSAPKDAFLNPTQIKKWEEINNKANTLEEQRLKVSKSDLISPLSTDDEVKKLRLKQGKIIKDARWVNENATPDEKIVVPYLDQYEIPKAVIFGMAQAETGFGKNTVGQNNLINIGAYDSNPRGAINYDTLDKSAEAAAKLLSGQFKKTNGTIDTRYKPAWENREDPVKMLKMIEAAGFAGDPSTWKARSIAEGGAGLTYDHWSDFVMDTKEWKKWINQ